MMPSSEVGKKGQVAGCNQFMPNETTTPLTKEKRRFALYRSCGHSHARSVTPTHLADGKDHHHHPGNFELQLAGNVTQCKSMCGDRAGKKALFSSPPDEQSITLCGNLVGIKSLNARPPPLPLSCMQTTKPTPFHGFGLPQTLVLV